MERTDLMDTSEWAHRFIVERLRQMTPEERMLKAFELSELGREIHKEAMRRLAEEKACS